MDARDVDVAEDSKMENIHGRSDYLVKIDSTGRHTAIPSDQYKTS